MLRIKKLHIFLLFVILLHDKAIQNIPECIYNLIIRPIVLIVGFYENIDFVYYTNIGYLNPEINVAIAKECAGFRFLFIALALIYILIFKYKKRNAERIFYSFIGFFGAYILTVISNSIRIILLINIKRSMILPDYINALAHECIGVIVYLGSLLLMYMLIDALFKRRCIDGTLT